MSHSPTSFFTHWLRQWHSLPWIKWRISLVLNIVGNVSDKELIKIYSITRHTLYIYIWLTKCCQKYSSHSQHRYLFVERRAAGAEQWREGPKLNHHHSEGAVHRGPRYHQHVCRPQKSAFLSPVSYQDKCSNWNKSQLQETVSSFSELYFSLRSLGAATNDKYFHDWSTYYCLH